MVFYEKMDKKAWMLMFDTVLAFPKYEKIMEEYSKKASIATDFYEKDQNLYYQKIEDAGKELQQNLESMIQERLDKFEIGLNDITEFFKNAVTMDYDEMRKVYPKRIIKRKHEKENEYSPIDHLIPNEELNDVCLDKSKLTELVKKIALSSYEHGIKTKDATYMELESLANENNTEDEVIEANSGKVMTLQMAYLSAMLHKLNPEKIELDIPEGIVYNGNIGYNLNFEGNVVINGDMERFGVMVERGNFTINGDIGTLKLYSKKLNVTANSNIKNLFADTLGELVICGDVSNARIWPYFDSILINGNVLIEYIDFPKEGISKKELKNNLGEYYYKIYEKSRREKLEINGDLDICRQSEGVISNEHFYEILKKIDVSGKIKVMDY